MTETSPWCFFSTPSSASVCKFRSRKGRAARHHRARRIPKGGRGHRFALGGNKFGTLAPLGLGLPGHRAFHTVGQLVILQLDEVHFQPRLRVATSRIFWTLALMTSISESASSRVCCPTTSRSVVWAILVDHDVDVSRWAITDFSGSTTRK